MIQLTRKLTLLNRVYDLYDQYVKTLDAICRRTCCDCCTCNVSATTLEAHHIINSLNSHQLLQINKRVAPQRDMPRFIPKITFNRLADIVVSGKEPPDEAMDVSWGACPLLADHICLIYPFRPFGCRCLISTKPCGQTGAAFMDEFTVTVNHLFLQVIEHIDQDGLSGNLSDVIAFGLSGDTTYEFKEQNDCHHLVSNSPLRSLLIPPEHQTKIAPILDQIRAFPI